MFQPSFDINSTKSLFHHGYLLENFVLGFFLLFPAYEWRFGVLVGQLFFGNDQQVILQLLMPPIRQEKTRGERIAEWSSHALRPPRWPDVAESRSRSGVG